MSTPEIPTWQLRAGFASALSTMYGAIGHHTHDPYNLYDATAQEPPT